MHDIHALGVSGDRAVAIIADRQGGAIALWQLVAVGLGRGATGHRVANGRLHRMYRGVYAVGRASVSAEGRLIAAVLACGSDAVLSHRSAAALWGIRVASSPAVDVTAVGRRGQPGIRLHRVRRLHPEDVSVRNGIPVTTLARTLLDCAEVLAPRQLRNAIEDAERLRLFDLRAVEECGERNPGRRGVKALHAAIADVQGEPADLRSPLERRFLDFCRDAGLPEPATNVSVCGHTVDAAWVRQQVVVELDSFEFHRTRVAFEEDRVRSADLQLGEFRVLQVTHRRLSREAHKLEATLRAFLAL